MTCQAKRAASGYWSCDKCKRMWNAAANKDGWRPEECSIQRTYPQSAKGQDLVALLRAESKSTLVSRMTGRLLSRAADYIENLEKGHPA